ncbi:MAG: methyltransferase, partial [Chitinivibrionales bacterium]|nr:methyltransferase [Chitinivibrionales bacterium]
SFADTSVDLVLAKMPYRDKCIVRQGSFPGTAADVDDTFCFVSLDADLYEPTIEGLRFFYPRLSPGGQIFVHDFSGPGYGGVRAGVEEFCSKKQVGFAHMGDAGGSVVIAKPLHASQAARRE